MILAHEVALKNLLCFPIHFTPLDVQHSAAKHGQERLWWHTENIMFLHLGGNFLPITLFTAVRREEDTEQELRVYLVGVRN